MLTFRRSLETLRSSDQTGVSAKIDLAKWNIYGFIEKLQSRYPFRFAPARRNLESELNRQAQERLATHYLLGATAEVSALDPAVKDLVWKLGGYLSEQIGKGGENFHPREFTREERNLAREIGAPNFEALLQRAEELSLAMRFKLEPINSAEHVRCWCFRYVGQLLKAAKWESAQPGD